MWYKESVFYQIYPLGLCGAPRENDGQVVSRIIQLLDWLPHLQKMNINGVILILCLIVIDTAMIPAISIN